MKPKIAPAVDLLPPDPKLARFREHDPFPAKTARAKAILAKTDVAKLGARLRQAAGKA